MSPSALGTRICNAGFTLKGGALMEYVYGHKRAAPESTTRPATVTPMLSPEPVAQAARRADRRAVMQEALDAMNGKPKDTAEEGNPLRKRILVGVLIGTAVLGVIVWALN